MKIGIFDSGVGGLIVAARIMKALPQYDYLYLGDAKRVPYGDRSEAEIYQFTVEALEYLFAHDCSLVIIACNTISAEALHMVQTEFLPQKFPDKKVLGVVIPAAEEAARVTHTKRIGVIGTTTTVRSGAFPREIKKLLQDAVVVQEAATELVPLVEHHQGDTEALLKRYLEPIVQGEVDTLILGCTHYPQLKREIKELLPSGVQIVSPEEILPLKLQDYLSRHPEVESRLSRGGSRSYAVTRTTAGIEKLADELFGADIDLQLITLQN